MAIETVWINGGEANADGIITAQVKDGARVLSTFKGLSMKEVADKMLASAAASSGEIQRLRTTRLPDQSQAPKPLHPRVLTTDERFQASTRAMDPNQVPDVIEQVVSARLGAPLEVVAERLSKDTEAQARAYYKGEADAFAAAHPDYYPDAEGVNRSRLVNALENKGWDMTRNNLSLVYDELESQGLLLPRPEDDQQHQQQAGEIEPKPSQEPNLRTTRPRFAQSTGIRDAQASQTRPTAPPTAKLTQEDVDRMPRATYLAKLQDPQFAAAVNALHR